MRLARATRSEFTKQFSTSIWWILAIVLVLYIAMTAGGLAFVLAGVADGLLPGSDGIPAFTDSATVIYGFSTSLGYVFALLLGTLLVTSEFRHQTLTPTFLAVPRRGTALIAKLIVAAVLGTFYGILALAAAVGPGAGIFAAFGQPTGLDNPDMWWMFARIVLALVLWTLLGVGVGALVRNQVAAVVGVIAFTQFLEPVVRLAAGFIDGASDIAKYLPGAASDALVGTGYLDFVASGTSTSMEWWLGAIVLGAYALVFVILGYLTSWRRDIS